MFHSRCIPLNHHHCFEVNLQLGAVQTLCSHPLPNRCLHLEWNFITLMQILLLSLFFRRFNLRLNRKNSFTLFGLLIIGELIWLTLACDSSKIVVAPNEPTVFFLFFAISLSCPGDCSPRQQLIQTTTSRHISRLSL